MAPLAFRRREISNDVRELQSSKDPRARFAFDYFCYRVGIHADMLAAALRGLDAFVFTAGIGENSANIRAEIVAKLAWLGAWKAIFTRTPWSGSMPIGNSPGLYPDRDSFPAKGQDVAC